MENGTVINTFSAFSLRYLHGYIINIVQRLIALRVTGLWRETGYFRQERRTKCNRVSVGTKWSDEVWPAVGPYTYSLHLTATLRRIHLVDPLDRSAA